MCTRLQYNLVLCKYALGIDHSAGWSESFGDIYFLIIVLLTNVETHK